MRHMHRPLTDNDARNGLPCGHHTHDHYSAVLHSHEDHRPVEKSRLRIAIVITGLTMVVEAVGGSISGSLALISDAGHMLTHAAALSVSLAAMYLAAMPTTRERSFGFYRVEVLAALFNAITLILITGFIAFEAYRRLVHPTPILAWEMLGIAVLGLVVNLVTALIMRGAGQDDLNFKSAFLHMLGDTISSVAIIIGALVIRFTGLLWIDPVLSVMICLVILAWAWSLLRESVRILLEAAPAELKVEEVRGTICGNFKIIRDLDDIHLWTITSRMYAMTAFVEIEKELSLSEQDDLGHALRHFVADKFGIGHAVFQFVPAGEK